MDDRDAPFRSVPLEVVVRTLRAERQELREACAVAHEARRRKPLNRPLFAAGFFVGLFILPVLFALYVWLRLSLG